MTDNLRDRIASHRSWGDGFCECEFEFGNDVLKWADHLIRELGLRRETESYGMSDSTRHRYVTEWTADE